MSILLIIEEYEYEEDVIGFKKRIYWFQKKKEKKRGCCLVCLLHFHGFSMKTTGA